MKLIDIDKLVSDYKSNNKNLQNVTWFELSNYEVKAIPVEWIEERLKRAVAFTHSKAEGNIIDDGCVITVVSASFTANVLLKLLEAWEGENETM